MDDLVNNKSLENKIAVVVGGGRGIGRAAAKSLARAGAAVNIVSRTRSELESVVNEIQEQGGSAQVHIVDATQSAQVRDLAGQLEATHGVVDILVNCAGAALIAPLEKTTEEDWDVVLDANLKSVYLCTYHLLDLLRKSENALVVNIASKVGLTGHALVSAYTAAKAGVIGFSRALAQELSAQDIRVVAICPGPVDTPMRWQATPGIDPESVLPAATVADMVLFLAALERGTKVSEIILESAAYDESAVPLEQN